MGAVNSGLTRVLRNSHAVMIWAVVLIALSIGFGLGAKIGNMPHWVGVALISAGAAAFTAGLALAAYAAVDAPGRRERPTITASLNYDNGMTLVGNVKASDLRWSDKMSVVVEAAHLTKDEPGETEWRTKKLLFVSRTGPDSNGDANIELHVPIRPEVDWDMVQVFGVVESVIPNPTKRLCTPTAPTNLGCFALRLPINRRPRLTATWSATGAHPALTVTTKAQDLPYTDLIRVSAFGLSRGKSTLLVQANLTTDSKGIVADTQVVPVDRRNSVVCVIAERQPIGSRGSVRLAPLAGKSCPDATDSRVVETLAVPPA